MRAAAALALASVAACANPIGVNADARVEGVMHKGGRGETTAGSVPSGDIPWARLLDAGCGYLDYDTSCPSERLARWRKVERSCADGDDIACLYVAHAKWRGCCLRKDRVGGRELYLRSCPGALEAVRAGRPVTANDASATTAAMSVYCPEADRSPECERCHEYNDVAGGKHAWAVRKESRMLPPCPPTGTGGGPIALLVTDCQRAMEGLGTWDFDCPPLPDDPPPASTPSCTLDWAGDASVVDVTVTGTLESDDVRRSLRTEAQQLSFCVARQLHLTPALEGPIPVSFAVKAGRLARVSVGDVAPELADCLTAAIEKVAPPPGEGEVTSVLKVTLRR